MFVSAVLFYAHWLSCLTLAKSHTSTSIIHFICRHGRKMMDKRRQQQQQQQQKQKLQNVPYKISKISLFVHTLTMLVLDFHHRHRFSRAILPKGVISIRFLFDMWHISNFQQCGIPFAGRIFHLIMSKLWVRWKRIGLKFDTKMPQAK